MTDLPNDRASSGCLRCDCAADWGCAVTAKLYRAMAEVIPHKEPAPIPSDAALGVWLAMMPLHEQGVGLNDAGSLQQVQHKIDAMLEELP